MPLNDPLEPLFELFFAIFTDGKGIRRPFPFAACLLAVGWVVLVVAGLLCLWR